MDEQTSDASVLARCATGDVVAARAFVLRHQRDVVRFLSRMLGVDDPAVDDVAQQTFVAALRASGSYRGGASARTWLLGVAHNKAKMEIRSRMRRRRALDLLGQLRLIAPAARTPEVERTQLVDRIDAAVRTLEPNRRAVFVLCEVEERSAAEVSTILGVPSGTVRRWRAEARRSLQPLLADLRQVEESP